MSLEAQDLTLDQDKGVMKVTVRRGHGVSLPSTRDIVRIHYTGRLEDETIFVTTTNRERKPLEFELGAKTVIKALDMAASSMKQGEVAYFECKPKYAYGAAGDPELGVPPNKIVIFQIEMIGWVTDLSEDRDGGILKSCIRVGIGGRDTCPRDGDALDVHITGECDGHVFDDRDVIFPLGEGCEYGICEGVEMALAKFRMNEKSKLEIKAEYCSGVEAFNVPRDRDLEFVVTLNNIKRMKNIYTLTRAEFDEQREYVKSKATKYFKEGKYALAARIYKRLEIYALGETVGYTDEMEEKRKFSEDEIELLKSMHLNIALCFLKMFKNLEARERCEKVLEMDPTNEKALFRIAQSYLNREEAEEAIEAFEKVLEVNPKNGAAIKSIQKCKDLQKKQRAHMKKTFNNFFNKLSKLPELDVPRDPAEEEEEEEPTYHLRRGPWDDVAPKKKQSLQITELDDDGNEKKN